MVLALVLEKFTYQELERIYKKSPETAVEIMRFGVFEKEAWAWIVMRGFYDYNYAAVASNPWLPDDLRRYCVERNGTDLQVEVAKNTALSNTEQEMLSFVKDLQTRKNLAANQALKKSVQKRLRKSKDSDILAALATNPAATKKTLTYLAKRGDDSIRIALCKNSNVTMDVVEQALHASLVELIENEEECRDE